MPVRQLSSNRTIDERWSILVSPFFKPLRFSWPSFLVSSVLHSFSTRASWAAWSSPSMIPGAVVIAVYSWLLLRIKISISVPLVMPRSFRGDTGNGNGSWPIAPLYGRFRCNSLSAIPAVVGWGDRRKFGTSLSLNLFAYPALYLIVFPPIYSFLRSDSFLVKPRKMIVL